MGGDGDATIVAVPAHQWDGGRATDRNNESLAPFMQAASVMVSPAAAAQEAVARSANAVRTAPAQLLPSAQAWLAALPPSAKRLLAGGVAGAVSKTATAPFECIRIRLMTSQASIGAAVLEVWRKGGPLAFFAGHSADMVRVVPSKAIELAAFDLYKSALVSLRPRRGAEKRGGSRQPNVVETTLAGAAAGLTSQLTLFPLETVRTRMAVQPEVYRSLVGTAFAIARQEGIPAFYRGLDASLVGVLPYAALKLGIYDGLKWAYRKHARDAKAPPPGTTLLFGAMAGVLSASFTYPLEVARRRMMMGAVYPNTFAAMRSIAANEGLSALFKGIQLSWLKQAPQYAVTFMAYDLIKVALAAQAPGEHGADSEGGNAQGQGGEGKEGRGSGKQKRKVAQRAGKDGGSGAAVEYK